MNVMCINIINSNSQWYEKHNHYKDALKEKEWIVWFLKKWGFPIELSENGYEFEQLSALRSLLTEAIDIIIAGNVLSEKLLQSMNIYLSKTTMHYEISVQDRQYSLTIKPHKLDWNYVSSEITASFLRFISEMDPNRFKRCENPDCKNVYYDSSKSQTRKWCCNTCSSLIKVRRHRGKQKAEQD